MRRTTALLLALLLPIGLLAACGDDGDDPRGSDGVSRSDGDLEALLLTTQDLDRLTQTGWAVDTSSDDEDGGDALECLQALADVDDAEALSSADTSLAHAGGLATLEESLDTYGDADALQDAFDVRAGIVDDCDEISLTVEGEELPGSIARADLPDLGDDSAAWLMSIDAHGTIVEAAIVLVRVGDLAVSILYTEIGGDAIAVAQRIAEAAVAKIEAG